MFQSGPVVVYGHATAAITAVAGPVAAAQAGDRSAGERLPADDLPSAEGVKQRELREEAVQAVLKGEATPEKINGSTVVRLGGLNLFRHKDRYVELAREKTDRIFVVLVDFGTERDPNYPDVDTNPNIPGPARFDGPLENEIPQPDRAVDNSTVALGLQPAVLPGPVLRRWRVAQELLRGAVLGAVQRQW